MAGCEGTQALAAGTAAVHNNIPLPETSAGTRNHVALDSAWTGTIHPLPSSTPRQ